MWMDTRRLTSSYSSSPSFVSEISVSVGNDGGGGSQLREWSSIIGIITAIVGNVLISFALNTQRYAHLRIEREHAETHRLSTRSGKGSSGGRNYGTATQEGIAEERARMNAKAPGPGGPQENGKKKLNGSAALHEEDEDADETQPLKASFESEDSLSAEKNDTDDSDERKSYLRSGYWWIGIIMMTVGEAGNFLAYGFAPASVVSPLGVVALISNCLIAPFLLKERFRQRDFWGVLVAIGGAVTIVLSAKNSETKMGPHDLWDAISRWEFLVYLGITLGAILALMIASPRYGGQTILIDLGLVGLFGGYTAICTKGVASLLSDTLWRTFTFPITYLLVAVLIISAVMQIRYINKALQHFDSTQVIPTQFVFFTISVIIGSAVLFREFESTTAQRVGEFIGGCLLTFFGVYLITSGRAGDDDGPDEEDEDSPERDAPIHLIDEEAASQDQNLNGTTGISYNQHPRPATPEGKVSDTYDDSSEGLSYKPSMAATTEQLPSGASSNAMEDYNPWSPAKDLLSGTKQAPSPFIRSRSDIPQTPRFNRNQSDYDTPYYTPATTAPGRPDLFLRTPSSPANPQTPTKAGRTVSPAKADPALRPPATPHRSARGSIARLTPGPLLTPLSSSLSAVVADSLRRGEGTSRQNQRRLKRGRDSQTRRQSVADEETLLRQQTRETEPDTDVEVADVIGGEGSITKKKSRLMSMSDAFGGFLGGRNKRRKEDEEDGDGGGGGVGT